MYRRITERTGLRYDFGYRRFQIKNKENIILFYKKKGFIKTKEQELNIQKNQRAFTLFY